MVHRSLISSGDDTADELSRAGALLQPSTVTCSLSLLPLVFAHLFLRVRGVKAHQYTEVLSVSTEELVLARPARCVLSHLRCNGHSSLLNSYLSTIERIENPSCSAWVIRPRTLLISFCAVQLDSLRGSLFGNFTFICEICSWPLGVTRLLGLHGLPPRPLSRNESGNNNNNRLCEESIQIKDKIVS